MEFSKGCANREVHSNASLPQGTRETSNKQPNFTPKATRKRIVKKKNLKLVGSNKWVYVFNIKIRAVMQNT